MQKAFGLSLLRRISPYLNEAASIRIYNASLHSQLLYCSSDWRSCFHTQLLQVLRQQKRAARVILSTDFATSFRSLFSRLRWIPIIDLIKCKKIQLLFTVLVNPDATLDVREKFTFLATSRFGRYVTCGAMANNSHLKQLRNKFGKSSFSFSPVSVV